MKIIESALKASTYIAEIKAKGKKIGFVPTLGGLHKGHQLLMQKAREQNDVTVISIFLNPMQFRKKHFIEYPSDFELDKVIAKKKRITLIFHPTIKEMFPFVRYLDDFFPFQNDEFKARDPERFVIEPKVQNSIDELIRVPNEMVYQLDGKLHPWFFDASATIVHKLFKILGRTGIIKLNEEEIEEKSENQVGGGTGQQDDDPLPGLLASVAVGSVVPGQGIAVVLPFHFHIPAQRDGAEGPFRTAAVPTAQHPAESDAETLHGHSEESGGGEMSYLVKEDHHRESGQCDQEIEDQCHGTPAFFEKDYIEKGFRIEGDWQRYFQRLWLK